MWYLIVATIRTLTDIYNYRTVDYSCAVTKQFFLLRIMGEE